MTEKSETEAIADIARQAVRTEQFTAAIGGENVPLAVLPGQRDKFVDLRQFASQPRRRTGVATLFDPKSFVAYVRQFATPRCVIAADVEKVSLTALLDYHESGDGGARHADFRASYTLRPTEDWKRWLGQNGKALNQVAFAQFLEDNLANIAVPDGAALLDMCQNLHVRTDVTFKSAIRLTDGTTKLTFEENSEGATKGDLKLPTEITLGLTPFEGSSQFAITARLRYRVTSGVLSMWFELVRPDQVIATAFRDVETDVKAFLVDLPHLWIEGAV